MKTNKNFGTTKCCGMYNKRTQDIVWIGIWIQYIGGK